MDIIAAAIVSWAVFDLAVLGRGSTQTVDATQHAPDLAAGRRVAAIVARRAGRFAFGLILFHLLAGAALMATNARSQILLTVWLNSVFLSVATMALLPAGLAAAAMTRSPILPLLRGQRRGPRARALLVSGLLGLPLLASTILFSWAAWNPGETAEQIFGPADRGLTPTTVLVFVCVAVSAAVLEEILYRQYLLCRLGAMLVGLGLPRVAALTAATALSTALFALAHGGMVEPAWLKYTQTAILGVALAIAQIRLGLESAVTIHLAFNILAPSAMLVVRLAQ